MAGIFDSLDDFMAAIAKHPGAETLFSALPLAAGTFMLSRPQTTLGTPIGALLAGLGGFGAYQGIQGTNERQQQEEASKQSAKIADLIKQASPSAEPLPVFNQNALRAGAGLGDLKSLDEAAGYTGTKQRMVYDAKRGGSINLDTGQFTPIKDLPQLPESSDPKTLAQLDLLNAKKLFPNDQAKQAAYVAKQENDRRLAYEKQFEPMAEARAVAQGKAMVPIEVSKAQQIENAKANTPAGRLEQEARSVKTAEDTIKLAGDVFDTYVASPGLSAGIKRALSGSRNATIRKMRPVRAPDGSIAGFLLPTGTFVPIGAGE